MYTIQAIELFYGDTLPVTLHVAADSTIYINVKSYCDTLYRNKTQVKLPAVQVAKL